MPFDRSFGTVTKLLSAGAGKRMVVFLPWRFDRLPGLHSRIPRKELTMNRFTPRRCGPSPTSLLSAFALSLTSLGLFFAAPRTAIAAPVGCTVQAGTATPSIQQAVNNGCAQVLVKPGTYHENVVIPAARALS